MQRNHPNVRQYIRELFGPQGNGILENGDIRVAIEIERDDNNVPVAIQIRHIHPAPRIQGALLQPPPLINEFWAEPSAELANHILARDLLQPDFYGFVNNLNNFDQMDQMDRMDEDDDLPPGVRDRRHSPMRSRRAVVKSPKKKVVKKKVVKKKVVKSPKKRVSKSPKKRVSKSPKKRVSNNNSDCRVIDNLKKYINRPGPPRPANEDGCRNKIVSGNDGLLYQSKPTKAGIYRWVKIKN